MNDNRLIEDRKSLDDLKVYNFRIKLFGETIKAVGRRGAIEDRGDFQVIHKSVDSYNFIKDKLMEGGKAYIDMPDGSRLDLENVLK